jgi:phosphatidylglycerophosphatase C
MGSAVAAFDVDGTLTRRDVLVPFLARLTGARQVAVALAAEAVRSRGRDVWKAAVLRRLLAGRRVSDVDAAGAAFAADIEGRRLRPDVVARLRWHQAEGHHTVLVSAGLRAYLVPLAARLGVDHVICTDLAAGPDGLLTGALEGGNCRGPAKAERLRAWLATRGEPGGLWAYGDSAGDAELLALADHPLRVARRPLVPAVPAAFA